MRDDQRNTDANKHPTNPPIDQPIEVKKTDGLEATNMPTDTLSTKPSTDKPSTDKLTKPEVNSPPRREAEQPVIDRTSTITPKHVSTTAISESAALIKGPKLIPNGSRAFLWYILSLVVLALDQWTKWLAETKLNFHDPVPVIDPVLNWTLAYNYGAAFSFLADQSGWQKWFFAGLALVMAVFLLIYLTKTPRKAKLLNTGLALVLGGALGNLIDRLLHGHVIDFIHVHYADVWHYPIFNIADMGICIGVAFIVIDLLFLEGKRNSHKRHAR